MGYEFFNPRFVGLHLSILVSTLAIGCNPRHRILSQSSDVLWRTHAIQHAVFACGLESLFLSSIHAMLLWGVRSHVHLHYRQLDRVHNMHCAVTGQSENISKQSHTDGRIHIYIYIYIYNS